MRFTGTLAFAGSEHTPDCDASAVPRIDLYHAGCADRAFVALGVPRATTKGTPGLEVPFALECECATTDDPFYHLLMVDGFATYRNYEKTPVVVNYGSQALYPARNAVHDVTIRNAFQGDTMATLRVRVDESPVEANEHAPRLVGATVNTQRTLLAACDAHEARMMAPFERTGTARTALLTPAASYLAQVHIPYDYTSQGDLPGDLFWYPRPGRNDVVAAQAGLYPHVMRLALRRYDLSENDFVAAVASLDLGGGAPPHARLDDAAAALVAAVSMQSASYPYVSDFIVRNGKRKPVENFGYDDTTGAGDCEDVSRSTLMMLRDLRELEWDDLALAAAGRLARHYVPMAILCTVTTPAAAHLTKYSIAGNTAESAHATVQLVPAGLFERMALAADGNDSEAAREALLKELREDHGYVVGRHSDVLPLLMAEATGHVAPIVRCAHPPRPTSLLAAATAADHDAVRAHWSGIAKFGVTVGHRTTAEAAAAGTNMSSFYRRWVHGFTVAGERPRMFTFVDAARPTVFGTRIEAHVGADAHTRVRARVHARPTDESIGAAQYMRQMMHPPVVQRPASEPPADAPAAYMAKLAATRAIAPDAPAPRAAVDAFVRETDVSAALVKEIDRAYRRIPNALGIEVHREFVAANSRSYRVRVLLA